VLYGYENRSLTFRKDCKLRVFEEKILTEVFGSKGLRKWCGEGFTMNKPISFYNLSNIRRTIKCTGLGRAKHLASLK
jgi:hypothetical protein